MVNTKSAYKRIQIAERNRIRNKAHKATIKTFIKKTLAILKILNSQNVTTAKNLLGISCSKIDKAVQKGILHPNNGNSKKSSLHKHFMYVMRHAKL